MKPRQWYRFDAKADQPAADLYIYSDIGYSYWDDNTVDSQTFIDALRGLPAGVIELNVHINSLGGDVFEAVAITNALRAWGSVAGRTVKTLIEGIAASAATIVAMGGTTIVIADNALMMVHNPWTIAIGNAAEMRKTADSLDAVRNVIVATYKWHSSLSDEELVALLDAETWMDADTAIAKGFATEKTQGLTASDGIETKVLARLNVPAAYRASVQALIAKPTPTPAPPTPANATEVLRLCREGDCLDLAEELLASGATTEQVNGRLTEARTAKAAATARATEITAVCTASKLPELAASYIAGAMTADAVRAQLTIVTAKLDKVEVDGNLTPDTPLTSKARLNTADVYAARNGTAQKG